MSSLPSSFPVPQKLEDTHLTKTLQKQICSTIRHGRQGLLLLGCSGSGKSLVINITSKSQPGSSNYVFGGPSGTTVPDQRSGLRCFCNTIHPLNKRAFVTADEIDEMTDQQQIVLSQSFDSFSNKVTFVATASSIARVIPELASRFNHVYLSLPSPSYLRRLISTCWTGKHALSKCVIQSLVKNTGHSIPRLLSILDKLFILDIPVTTRLVSNSCSVVDPVLCESYIKSCLAGDLKRGLKCLRQLTERGIDPEDILSGIGELLERVPMGNSHVALQSYVSAVHYSFRCNDKLTSLYFLAVELAERNQSEA